MNKSETASSESDENSEESSSSDSCSSSASSDSDSSSQEPAFSVQSKDHASGLKLFLAYSKHSDDLLCSDNEADRPPPCGAPMSQAQAQRANMNSDLGAKRSAEYCSTSRNSRLSPGDSSSSSQRGRLKGCNKGTLQPNMSRTVPAKGLDRPRPPVGAPEPPQRPEDQKLEPSTGPVISAGAEKTSADSSSSSKECQGRVIVGDIKDVTETSDPDVLSRTDSQVSENGAPTCAVAEADSVEKPESERASVISNVDYTSTEEDFEDSRQQTRQPQAPLYQQHVSSGLAEPSDSLLRLDSMSLPNVSPDSGIQSIAGSPSGNDSPSSVTSVSAGEQGCESQLQVQTPSHIQTQESKLLQPPPPPPLSTPLQLEGDDTGCSTSNTNRGCEMVAVEGDSVEHGGEKTSADKIVDCGKTGIESDLSQIPSPFRGPPSGRKKRGRPPKSKKAQFLQHKKSTLYSGLYSSSGDFSARASSSSSSSSAPEPRPEKLDNIENGALPASRGCESQEEVPLQDNSKHTESRVDSGPKPSSEITLTTDSSLMKEKAVCIGKKVGRPKGNRRFKKNFFTYIKNRAQKLKGRSAGSSSMQPPARSAVQVSLESRDPSGEPVVKRRRGRPRKNPIPVGARSPPRQTERQRVLATSEEKRGKRLLEWSGNSSSTTKRNKQLGVEKKVSGDSELASLIQSIQASIHTQFQGGDVDESSEFAMDTNSDINVIEPSLPSYSGKGSVSKPSQKVKPASKVATKPKKPKLHVMMRKTKRRKRKRLQVKSSPVASLTSSLSPSRSPLYAHSGSSSFKDLSQQHNNLFGSSPSGSLGFFRYRPSKILKQSSFSLHSSALGSVLNRQKDDSSGDEDKDGSEGRKKKKKKKLLYFKSKHKNIIDPAFMAELGTLNSSMESLTISEKAYIRVKPGEVPLPSIFKLTIIDVKKKKKDRLILEPPAVPAADKGKKTKVRKDSREREPAMPELVKEKAKAVRKKSQSEDNHPPSLEIQVARDQCLPPKKRHRMKFAAETSGAAASSQSEAHPPEKRRPGRPRKYPLPDVAGTSDKGSASESKDSNRGHSTSSTPVSSPGRPTNKGQRMRHSSTENAINNKEKFDDFQAHGRASATPTSQAKPHVLTCPRHAAYKSVSELAACAECTLLAQSQPQTSPQTHSHDSARQQTSDNSSPAARASKSRQQLLKKHKVKVDKTLRSCNSGGGTGGSVDAGRGAISPKSRTKLAAASLPSAEVVINPLPKSTLTAVIQSLPARKELCNTSDFSDSGADDESVIRNVCSESEPLPVEHCRKRKLSSSDSGAASKTKKRAKDSSQLEDLSCLQESAVSGSVLGGNSSGRRNSHENQPPRKRYQRVGLFSDFYKDDEPKKRSENLLRNPGRAVFSREDTAACLLPPPIHFGKHFRERTIDFQLPYDIWWMYTNDMLPKKEEQRPKFKRIRNNIYVDVKPNSRKFEPHPCNCKRPTESGEKGCQDDCLNRVVFTECTPETCPCAEACSNQRIQHHEFAPSLEKFLTEDRGFGVRTLKFIPTGHFILEYLGEVVSETEFRRRMTEEYSQERHHYCLNMDGRTVIDGYRMGNLTRFVNHSCQPNCEMQKWNVNGLYRMVLLALRDIKPYEEISYDYNFHAFNLETQQACRCGSGQCRGVIGGKWQRSGQVGTHTLRSTRASTSTPFFPLPSVGSHKQHNSKPPSSSCGSVTRALEKKQQVADGGMNRLLSNSMKPMSQRERTYARRHSIFLVRNIDRARQGRQQTEESSPDKVGDQTIQQSTFEKVPDVLSMKEVNDRSVKTRLVALAEENPELQRRHRLAVIFNKIYSAVVSLRDDEGGSPATQSIPLQQEVRRLLMVLPSRKKYADYYRLISDPIDLTTIRNNIKRGHYTDLQTIDADFNRLFKNVETYHGKKSETGKLITRLRRVYQAARAEAIPQLEEVSGEGVASTSSSEVDSTETVETKAEPEDEEEEEVIRCICGVYRDEGLMIQCEKCFIWQHCDCVQVSGDVEHYLCEICDPRPYDREIKLVPQPDNAEEDCEYYMTLLRDDLLVAIGDYVYLMRDYKHGKDGVPVRSSLRLVSTTSPDKMDIFLIEELFKNSKGERFAMGTPFVRPQETFHEPTRKFFPNELFRLPTYEIVPLELVAGKCVVMDLNTYCKGRPCGFRSQDLYICEYRVDKTAHLFHKIVKQRYPINTKSYCFEKYETRLCPKRTLTPHEVPEEYKKRLPGERHNNNSSSHNARKSSSSSSASPLPAEASGKTACKVEDSSKKPADRGQCHDLTGVTEEKRQAKKERLNKLVTKLMASFPSKQKVDLSYLLDGSLGKRPRKKPVASFS